jgi:branched-chain amino acid transport system substrate-binding protein
MIRRSSVRTFATSVLFLMVSAAAPAKAADAVRIGLSLSLTGPTAPAGKQVLAGLEIWRDDVNQKGGLLGRPVELV